MANIEILVGSMLGAAEFVAEDLCEALQAAGHHARIQNPAQLSGLLQDPSSIWLICTSTHGAGEIPDNLQPFAADLKSQRPSLTARHYGVVALGNTDYDTYCQAGKNLDRQLAELGAVRIGDRLEIDIKHTQDPESAALSWLDHWITQIKPA